MTNVSGLLARWTKVPKKYLRINALTQIMAIVLFTDFGAADPYVGQVKAALEKEAPGAPVIDLLNEAPAYRVRAAAHLLASLVPEFAQGSVFLAVVDPGVGGARLPVALRADGYRFVGPDNGLLSVFAARAHDAEVWRIDWTPERLSPSFHGRDLFAPVAARLATGRVPSGWLSPLPSLSVEFGAGDLAEIIYVDHYGNAVTGLRARTASPEALLVAGGRRLRYVRVFSEARDAAPFWYENSQGLIEIAMNQASAARELGLEVGTPLAWAA
jgi:S-adenosyl-L-methionine hydrolase (adenosine-forming)